MNKTKPIGVRFNKEKLDFIKKEENLKTVQQVVNFLIDQYWWKARIPLKSYELPKPDQQVMGNVFGWDKKEHDDTPYTPPKKFVLKRTYEQYSQLKIECASAEEWAELRAEIEAADHIPLKLRKILLNQN